MTRVVRMMAVACALAAPGVVAAQATDDRAVRVGVSGGLSLPTGDFATGRNSGYTVSGHVYLRPAMLGALRLRGDVSRDQWDDEGGGANTRAIGVVANLLYDLGAGGQSMVRPYVLGGFGGFNRKASVRGAEGVTDPGVQVGAGLTFQLTGFSTFAEAKLVNVFANGGSARWVPVSFGVRF